MKIHETAFYATCKKLNKLIKEAEETELDVEMEDVKGDEGAEGKGSVSTIIDELKAVREEMTDEEKETLDAAFKLIKKYIKVDVEAEDSENDEGEEESEDEE